ncbi:hypothetical protein GCM10027020_07140 [Nocardioides salsibiostraticola]
MSIEQVDPFDLPDWLGEGDVTWSAESGLRTGHHVLGTLTGTGPALGCDLLAVDEAYPSPVASDDTRLLAHQAWRHGQVYLLHLGAHGGARLTLAVPGTAFSADLVLDVIGRLAKAVGASAERYAVSLRIGDSE